MISVDLTYSLDELLKFDDQRFIEYSYNGILGRDVDPSGLMHHLELLMVGTSRLDILVRLADSEEAQVKGTTMSRLAVQARTRALLEVAPLPWLRRLSPVQSYFANRIRDRLTKQFGPETPPPIVPHSDRTIAAPSGPPMVRVRHVPAAKWSPLSQLQTQEGAPESRLWVDLTNALQWPRGIVGIVRAELEIACQLKRVAPRVRFSIQIDQGFVEVSDDELAWLINADNVADAYMTFFGRYKGTVEETKSINVEFPLTTEFFHPYRDGDIILCVGWMDSQKEKYFSQLKDQYPEIYICYLIYDIILLLDETRHLYDKTHSDKFHDYVKWISHHCDFILYGGTTAQSDTIALQRAQGWPTPPSRAIKFGTDIIKLDDQSAEQTLLTGLGVTGPFMMVVGSLEPRKNYETLYRAYLMALELTDQPLPQLFICGRPASRVDDLVDTLDRDPRLKGRVIRVAPTDSELAALYKNCQFTLLASLYEGWSLTLPESLDQGKFCICADTPSLREIGGDLIDYVHPFDVRGWAEKIIFYASNDKLLREREVKIARGWPPIRWSDTARMILDFLDEAVAAHPPQPARIENFHSGIWREPTIWMDLTLTFLQWQGGVQGIIRAELTYARMLRELAPNTRFFAFHNGYFFEIEPALLTWLDGDGDLSAAYAFFHKFWNEREQSGHSYRNPFTLTGPIEGHPAYLPAFPANAVIFYAGIDFASFDGEGKPELHQIAQVKRLIRPGHGIITSQLIYDFTPTLLPHLHMPSTCIGYGPFIDYVSNHMDHIVYGGRTAQRDGHAIQNANGWLQPDSDYVEFGSDITVEAPVEADPNAERDAEMLSALGITSDFVITVGTIQPRKNHEVLYRAYLSLLEKNTLKKPLQMVFVGINGWKSDDLIQTIKADDRIKDKILIVSPSDAELDALYRHCLFTLLPSFYEGWSLTLPESLSYGKFCLVSDVAPLRETGGELVDYVHPLDPFAWAERIAYYVQRPMALSTRERKIKAEWKPRSWRQATEMLIGVLHQAHRRAVGLQPKQSLADMRGQE